LTLVVAQEECQLGNGYDHSDCDNNAVRSLEVLPAQFAGHLIGESAKVQGVDAEDGTADQSEHHEVVVPVHLCPVAGVFGPFYG